MADKTIGELPAIENVTDGTLIPVEQAEGRILADPCAGCPPAVPVLIAGERIDAEAIRCFRYYGIGTVMVMKQRNTARPACP